MFEGWKEQKEQLARNGNVNMKFPFRAENIYEGL